MKTIFKEYFPHGPLPGKIIPYAHKGEWAVHEILPFLFQYIGPFHLSVASFNISEDSLRPMFFMKEKNKLLSVRFLFDMNVHRHKIDMMFFSSSVADQILINSHEDFAGPKQAYKLCNGGKCQYEPGNAS